ncbi:MAG: Gfo/Idh/MocA family oxidoreductase [Ruminococcaceae bacterium]|nr:Gfo/Idh/MocA family oxidoreductase [Oscillospiraceae bacterium]
MNKKYGFGIVGCGVISKWHIAAINAIDNAELIGVFDQHRSGAEKIAGEQSCKVFDTYEEMLCCDKIDIINICTPSGTHAPLAVEAAKHNKNIIVEKPMAITKQQIDELTYTVEKNNVKLAVISQLRFKDSIQKVKSAIRNGELGDIVLGDVYMKYYRSQEYYDSSGWRGTWEMDGGGALMNQGIHGIDLLQYLVGPIKSVMGMCKTLARDIQVEDTANVIVEFQSGAIGVIQGTTSVEPGYPRIIQISGTKGTIEITEDTITRWDVGGSALRGKQEGFGSIKSYRDPQGLESGSHILQIKDFISAIEEGRSPLVDLYEGKKTVEIILGAYESAKSGKKVLL